MGTRARQANGDLRISRAVRRGGSASPGSKRDDGCVGLTFDGRIRSVTMLRPSVNRQFGSVVARSNPLASYSGTSRPQGRCNDDELHPCPDPWALWRKQSGGSRGIADQSGAPDERLPGAARKLEPLLGGTSRHCSRFQATLTRAFWGRVVEWSDSWAEPRPQRSPSQVPLSTAWKRQSGKHIVCTHIATPCGGAGSDLT